MRKLILVALLASSLCLATSGCSLIGAIATLGTDPEEEDGSLGTKAEGFDTPPSMIASERDSWSF